MFILAFALFYDECDTYLYNWFCTIVSTSDIGCVYVANSAT